MPQAHVHSPVDKAAYLRREKIAAAKHEFVGGETCASGRASLHYYLLVDSERPWDRVFFCDEHDAWFEQELPAEDRVGVACGGTRLTLDDLYEDTGLLVV